MRRGAKPTKAKVEAKPPAARKSPKISVARREPGGFNADEISLLQIFADQAVIAIQNVRLFKELEAANRELAAASQHKSEFLANMSALDAAVPSSIVAREETVLPTTKSRIFGAGPQANPQPSKRWRPGAAGRWV